MPIKYWARVEWCNDDGDGSVSQKHAQRRFSISNEQKDNKTRDRIRFIRFFCAGVECATVNGLSFFYVWRIKKTFLCTFRSNTSLIIRIRWSSLIINVFLFTVVRLLKLRMHISNGFVLVPLHWKMNNSVANECCSGFSTQFFFVTNCIQVERWNLGESAIKLSMSMKWMRLSDANCRAGVDIDVDGDIWVNIFKGAFDL